MRTRGAPLLLALSVGMVLADSSVVTLALPAILRDFDASVPSVAWVLIAFNLALALAALPGFRLARRRTAEAYAIASAGFAAVSVLCAAAPSLGVLIAARAGQGVLGAVVVAGALELLLRRTPRRRAIGLWAAAGVLGSALGPALGGFLTQAFSWQAMFALQAPVAVAAMLGASRALGPPVVSPEPAATEPPPPHAADPAPRAPTERPSPAPRVAYSAEPAAPERPSPAPLAALTLVSAALSAALFLLVVMLIEGWRLSPGEAALVVTAMPLAALVAGRWARDRHRLAPALPGCVLLAGGLSALGVLPGAGAAWTIAPQLAIGAGLGLSLGALIGVMVDGDGDGATFDEDAVGGAAAWTIAARHAGIVVGLLVLTPIFSADLDGVLEPAQRAGLAQVLDAPVALQPKIALARALGEEVGKVSDQQLPDLDAAFARVDVPAAERADVARLRDVLHDELDRAATSAFSRSFLAAALLALLAAGAAGVAVLRARAGPGAPEVTGADGVAVLRPRAGPGAPEVAGAAPSANGSRLRPAPALHVALPAACAAAAALVAAYVALGGASYGPTPVADPCAARARPAVERVQRVALVTIDGAACALRMSREQLLLAVLARDLPPATTDDELSTALVAGVDRAEREGALGAIEATGLRLAIRLGGALGVTGLLLGE